MNARWAETSEEHEELLTQHHQTLSLHENNIQQRATLEEMNKKNDSSEHEKLKIMVSDGLKRRAAVRTVRTVQTDVETLLRKTEYTEKMCKISQRFIEWFHQRGSAYEQNCQTIERQLNTLVVSSDPRVRQPFSNQVRLDSVGVVNPDEESGGGGGGGGMVDGKQSFA